MSLTLTNNGEGGNFDPAPEGMHDAICVDVIDLGFVTTAFGEKDMLRVYWELPGTQMSNGQPFVVSKRYNKSLHAKSTLNKDLAKWRGKQIGEGESIDLSKLPGASCKIEVEHAVDGDRTYARVGYIGKPDKKLTASGTWDPEQARQRIAERKAKEQGHAPRHTTAPAPAPAPKPKPVEVADADDDDVPF